ncbi:transposase [Bradyrhizobium sp. USDA 4509]
MRYKLSDEEWAAIKPMLPNKPRGVPRVNDRRVLNGIRLARTRVGIMKFVRCLLAAALLLAGVGASHAAVRIADDRGGQIGGYITKFQRLRSSGQSVIIDGLCASACPIVLGAVPHDKICVTSRAALGFHAAYDFGTNGRTFTNREATMMLYYIQHRCSGGSPRAAG